MLNQRRGMRAFSVVLVVAMLFAAVFAIIGFSSADKSRGETLLGSIELGNTQLSATESVDTNVTYENEDIFTLLEIKQTDIASIMVTGQVDLTEYADVVAGDIGIRIGEDAVKALIMEIVVDAQGNFELEFILNSAFCSEYDNKVPVIVSYTKTADPSVVYEIKSTLGVFTYDFETGVLRYPAGAEYINESGEPAKLTTLYVPADAKRDADNKVTVTYQDTLLTFVANEVTVADAPSGDIGSVEDVNGSTVLLNTVVGLEYGYIKVDASISANYGQITNWKLADGDSMTLEGLTPGVLYTIWVRTPASEGVLASAPVLISKGNTLTAVDSDAKNAFLEKYAAVVVEGKELYSTDDPAVTAVPNDTLQLVTYYNALSDDVKALDIIKEKAKYLVLSNYLANHQDIIAAVKTADAYADLRTDFTYDQMYKAYSDFIAVMDLIAEAHLFDEADGEFVLELSLAVQKLYILLPVADTDEAADLKYESVAFIFDYMIDSYKELLEENDGVVVNGMLEQLYSGYNLDQFIMFRDEYEYGLFCKKYMDVLEGEDEPTIAQMEAVLEDFVEVEFFTDMGQITRSIMFRQFTQDLADLYAASLDKLIAKYDPEDDASVLDDLNVIRDMIKYVDPEAVDSEPVYGDYPEIVDAYYSAINLTKLYDKFVAAMAELEALAEDKPDAIVDIISTYMENVGMIYGDSYSGYFDATDKDAYTAACVAAIDLEVTKAKAHLAFLAKKDAAKAEIDALKDTNQAVIDAANKYIPDIDILSFNYNNIETLNADIDAIVAAAKAETDFEKKRAEVKANLEKDVADRKASGRYSADQIAQLESYLAEAIVLVNNLDYVAGKTVADLEAQQATSIAKFASVNVITVSAGNVPVTGDMSGAAYPSGYDFASGYWGNVTNANGFGSALALSIKKVDGEGDLDVKKIVLATGELKEAEAREAATDKVILLKLNISLSDGTTTFVGDNNGLYTVKVLIPEDLRDAEGLYVVSQSGDTTYVYETTREGNYLVFKVTQFGEFSIVGDKVVNLLWLIIVLAILFAVEIGVVVFFVIKTKKNVTAVVALPFLAVIYAPAGAIPTVIALGALAVVGAAAAVVTGIKSKKKR